MPLLDVSELLADPDFADDFTVVRSNRSLDVNGRTIDTPNNYYTFGSVQPAPEQRLIILPEGERDSDFISIVTPFKLVGVTDTTAPDRILWNDKIYQVRIIRDWSTYGNGFTEAICELVSLTTEGP